MSDIIREIAKHQTFRRLIILALFIGVLCLLKSLLNIILFTFIFSYLMYSLQGFLSSRLSNIVRVNQKVLVSIIYSVAVILITLGVYKLLPLVLKEGNQLVNQFIVFYKKPPENEVMKYIINYLNTAELGSYVSQGFDILYKSITNVGKLGVDILLSIVLSLFFVFESSSVTKFTSKLKFSKVSVIYSEISFFSKKFVQSFGKVIETQFLIALINGILSTIALIIMGFPNVLALGIMIFLLGLIPVAGVLISLVPLSLIAYSVGGIKSIIYVLIMIVVLHAIESYLLNPKLMSAKTNLPSFYTFIILIVAEHLFGVWGLIVGIPIFMFILDLIEIDNNASRQSK